jgi:hypothetical protein
MASTAFVQKMGIATKRSLNSLRARWNYLALALFACAACRDADASIQVADLPNGRDDVFASIAVTTNTPTSGASTSEEPTDSSAPHPQKAVNDAPLVFVNLDSSGPTGGSPSSTSHSGGASGSGSMSFLACGVLCLEADAYSTQIAFCKSCTLPMPPGLDLFRPPRLA